MSSLTSEVQDVAVNEAFVAPYVVSADVAGLVGRWATANGLIAPPAEFFDGMTASLADRLAVATGVPVEVVGQKELVEGMGKLISESQYPVISLDRAYFDGDNPGIAGFLDVTRAVKESYDETGKRTFVSAGDLVPRPGHPTLEEQLEALRSDTPSPITVVDDVIFSGDGMVNLAKELAAIGRPIAQVIAGIGIEEGLAKLRDAGIEVKCVRTYEDVMDEVCERDFFAGAPMSGRTVLGEDGSTWSAPYFEPYGNTEGWASIAPEAVRDFSKFCLSQSLSLWAEVERLNGRTIASDEVARPLQGANSQTSMATRLWYDYLNHP